MSRGGTFALVLTLAAGFVAPGCNGDGDPALPGSGGAGMGGAGGGARATGGDSRPVGGSATNTGGAWVAESGGASAGGAGLGGSHTGGSLGSSGGVAGGNSGGQNTTARGGSGGRSSTTGVGSGGKAMGGNTATSDAGSVAGGAPGTDAGATGKGLTVYYVRHAEVVANTVDAAQISAENADTLTALGERQVAALTTYLQGLGVTPDAVLVSPAPRAQKTIEPYLVAAGITGEIWIELNEIAGLPSTGAPLPSTPKYYTFYKATLAAQNLVFRDPSTTAFWQNDTYEAELLMVTTARNELLKRYGGSGKTIIVVGHAVAGAALIGLLRGNDLMNGVPTTGSSAVYILNTGVMRLTQDAQTSTFKLDGKNINNPATK